MHGLQESEPCHHESTKQFSYHMLIALACAMHCAVGVLLRKGGLQLRK